MRLKRSWGRPFVALACLMVWGCGDGGGASPADAGRVDGGGPPADGGASADAVVPRPDAGADAGPCDPAVERCPPADPVCYTPCRGDVVAADGTVRRCAQDGLMEGCLAGSVCHRGSCVPVTPMNAAVAEPGTCEAESDCPDFQTCIAGRCYSNCAGDADCNGEAEVCHRRVCRARCDEGRPCDGEEVACHGGVCLPLAAPGAAAPRDPEAAFEVSRAALRFTPGRPEAAFAITNRGSAPLTLTVSKVEQVSFDGRAARVVTEAPLAWIGLAGPAGAADGEALELTVPAGETVEVRVTDARHPDLARWEGRLRIAPDATVGLGPREVRLVYSEAVAGRWVGTAYVFGNFDDGARPLEGHFPLDAWRADRDDAGLLDDVPNAFLHAWAGYRAGRIDLDEMAALVDATLTGSWDFPRVRALCREASFDDRTACAPFGGSGARSVIPYTTERRTRRIPTGVVEMDFALHLGEAADCDGLTCLTGRLDSATALQYGADPEVVVALAGDPTGCTRQDDTLGCVKQIESLEAEIVVGARFPSEDACPDGFAASSVPWLVPGFASPSGGADDHRECRDAARPFADADASAAFAAANPIPDGRPRRRRLELVDGMIVEQQVMTLILRETVDPFHGGESLSSYLYVVLQRAPEALDAADVAGNRPAPGGGVDVRTGPTCDPGLVATVVGRDTGIGALTAGEASALACVLVTGGTGDAPTPLGPDEEVHYLCVWEEDAHLGGVDGDIDEPRRIRRAVLDAGPEGDQPCFPGAQVIWFAAPVGGPVADWDCSDERPETCLETLVTTARSGDVPLRLEPSARSLVPDAAPAVSFDLVYRCDAAGRAECDTNRYDLREGKSFFVADAGTTFFPPLAIEATRAFRYRTLFLDRGERAAPIGFAPEICRAGADRAPYCYDPAAVAAIRDRVDCALALYHGWLDGAVAVDADARATLRGLLEQSFAAFEAGGDGVAAHGFERLYAELLIMLGDDAYTAAFASRFDLAGAAVRAFEGARFEPGGVNLSGAAGHELALLYQATQHYQLVLDRFYAMAPRLWESLEAPPGDGYLSAATVTTYLDRVIRASTQTANAWSAVAARYQGLGRPDLAERVLARAYTRAHQESLVLAAFMRRVMDAVSPADVAPVARAIEDAQRRYRVAMPDMARRYRDVANGGLDPFGLPADFIPSPALDEDDVNGFEVLLDRARDRLELAAADEDAAILSRREFDTDLASFQGELITLRNRYEAELGAICGTFIDAEGRTRPAIARYAHLHPDLAGLDDPCGAAGNGELWVAGGDLQALQLSLQRVRQEATNTLAAIDDAQEWVAKQCDLIDEDVTRFLQDQGAVDGLQTAVDAMDSSIRQFDKVHDAITEATGRVGDISDSDTIGGLVTRTLAFGAFVASATANFIATTALEAAIDINNAEIRRIEREYEAYSIGRECDYLQAEQVFTIRALHRELLLTELDILDALWNVQTEFAHIQALSNERNRLEAEWRDAERLLADAAAAHADPNVRVYKNDAIRNADRSFARARREAWAATKMFEYYTAAAYPERDRLFLARMVRGGDANLTRYLDDLEDAFLAFEQDFGNPDTRVLTLSLRDDLLQIPRYAVDGSNRVLTAQERAERMRAALRDPGRLDADGALSLAFSTAFEDLSPRTVNHKILFIEVELFGQRLGDDVGRLYLRQRGTGVLEGTDGERRFFAFPPRTAVMNPFFNGNRAFGQDADGAITGPTRSIYRSYRFRERPVVQTDWELVIDRRREAVNRDIDLAGLDDLVVHVYYTDFTRD